MALIENIVASLKIFYIPKHQNAGLTNKYLPFIENRKNKNKTYWIKKIFQNRNTIHLKPQS